MKSLNQIVEMAGPGKRGPKTKAEKETDAKEAAAKEAREEAFRIKHARERHHHEVSFAPKEGKKFKEELESHLHANGFDKIHDGHKRSIFTKLDHNKEHHHIVTVNHPTVTGSYSDHSTDIRYNNHGGASHSMLTYRPQHHREEEMLAGHAHHKETKNRAEVLHKLNNLYTGQTFHLDD